MKTLTGRLTVSFDTLAELRADEASVRAEPSFYDIVVDEVALTISFNVSVTEA